MIRVNVKKQDSQIVLIELSGHAESAPEGEDLVCAGASACFLGALKAIENQKAVSIFYSKGNGKVQVISPLSEHDRIVLEVLIQQLELIAQSYPKNIRIISK